MTPNLPEIPDLAFAIGLPPADAIRYLQGKGYAITWSWTELWQEAHAKAFTVAGITRMDVLKDIHDAALKMLNEGGTARDFEKTLRPLLEQKGWWGKLAQTDLETGEMLGKGLTPRRLQTIYETNLQTAYSSGRYKAMLGNVGARPYWQYSAVMDRRTRPAHAALNGCTFRYDDPFWQSFYPPNGFRCRCSVRALGERDVQSEDVATSSSRGKLSEIDAPISRRNPDRGTARVARFEYGPGQYISPDVGWSYNPGRAWGQNLGALYAEKARALPPALRAAALKGRP